MAKHGPILYAEDEESDVFFLRRALEKTNLSIPLVHTRDGQEAIDYLDQPFTDVHPKPGLLLLDLKMPRLTGFDVLAWITNQPALKDLPAVVFTSSDSSKDRVMALQLGAADYCVKPCESAALVALIQGWHARWFSPPGSLPTERTSSASLPGRLDPHSVQEFSNHGAASSSDFKPSAFSPVAPGASLEAVRCDPPAQIGSPSSAGLRILLRRRNTQLYLQPSGEWSASRQTAREFTSSMVAYWWAREQELLGSDVLLASHDPQRDFVAMRL